MFFIIVRVLCSLVVFLDLVLVPVLMVLLVDCGLYLVLWSCVLCSLVLWTGFWFLLVFLFFVFVMCVLLFVRDHVFCSLFLVRVLVFKCVSWFCVLLLLTFVAVVCVLCSSF